MKRPLRIQVMPESGALPSCSSDFSTCHDAAAVPSICCHPCLAWPAQQIAVGVLIVSGLSSARLCGLPGECDMPWRPTTRV